jgi:hypothetical protein
VQRPQASVLIVQKMENMSSRPDLMKRLPDVPLQARPPRAQTDMNWTWLRHLRHAIVAVVMAS